MDIGYLVGFAGACVAWQYRKNEVAGLAAATTTGLASRAIYKKNFEYSWKLTNISLSESLRIASKALIAYLAVTSLSSRGSLKEALIISALGVSVAYKGIEDWRDSLNKIERYPEELSSMILASGIVLAAACGLKHFGIVK